MAVPMQRPTSSPLDPELVREVRRVGEAIATLQRMVEERGKRSSEDPAVEAAGKLRNLLRMLAGEPVEDGVNHPAEPALRAYWQEHPGLLPWNEALGGAARPGLFADFLRLAGRVRPIEADLRNRLLEEGLASESIDIRDAAVQAAELWADAAAAAALARHREEVPWLAEYVERVKREIGPGRAGS